MLVKAKEMARRVTGFSIPIFGLQWNPAPSDRDAIRRLLAFLEDRRALFNPMPAEVEDHVISSIHSIREECVRTVGSMSDKALGVQQVRAIGAACRRFLDEPYPSFEDIQQRREPYFHRSDRDFSLRRGTDVETFFTALGEFRAFVGTQIGALSALYEVDIEGELTRILPPPFEDLG